MSNRARGLLHIVCSGIVLARANPECSSANIQSQVHGFEDMSRVVRVYKRGKIEDGRVARIFPASERWDRLELTLVKVVLNRYERVLWDKSNDLRAGRKSN